MTTGVDNQHHMGAQRKAPMDKINIGQKQQRIKIKADKTPKRDNILVRQQSRCTIPFLVMWSRSQQVWTINITWAHREKPQMDKSTIGQKPQRIKIKADKTPKRGNILVRQQSRCTIPFLVMWSQVWRIITWGTEKSPNVDNQHHMDAHREKPQWTKVT